MSRLCRYTNHTSYYFNLEEETCRTIKFPVGILSPDWLANATYLGKETVDAHETNVWTKADGFIKYYADVDTSLPVTALDPCEMLQIFPQFCMSMSCSNVWLSSSKLNACASVQVRWIFFDGAQFEILSFVINETLPDAGWQAPSYCFEGPSERLPSNADTAA